MQILIAKQKYGDRYLDASTDKKLYKAALYLLKERYDEDWYSPYEPDGPEDPGYTEETIKTLPIGLQPEAIKTLKSYKRDLASYLNDKEFFNNVELALAQNDGKLAWQCLEQRSDGEYESVYLEKVETIE